VAHEYGGRLTSTEAQQQARRIGDDIGDGDHNLKISEGELKNYKGVSSNICKCIAQVRNERNEDGTGNQIYLGTFRTTEMVAIVFDTIVIHFMGDSSTNRLNFLDNVLT
jgi:hypothetical protein